MKNLVRQNIQDLKPYEPGKPIEELKREMGLKDIIKLASNENPIGPSPKAKAALLKAASMVNRYPDGSSYYLREKIARANKVKKENVIVGCGSDEIIDIIIKTFLDSSDEVVVTSSAFLEYSILTRVRGARLRTVVLDDFKYNINKILNAINNRTKIVFLGNPDNPTGAYLTKKDLKFLLRQFPEDTILVIDEAYRELVIKKDYSDPLKYIKKNNIIILRTFSKAYGLAGLRVGYAISQKESISVMNKVRLPFNVNLPAQMAAIAALDDRQYIKKVQSLINKGRLFLSLELKRMGFKIRVSPANFILVNCGNKSGNEVFTKLLKKGVIVRDMKAYGLGNYFRVNVGTEQENKQFIEALKSVR